MRDILKISWLVENYSWNLLYYEWLHSFYVMEILESRPAPHKLSSLYYIINNSGLFNICCLKAGVETVVLYSTHTTGQVWYKQLQGSSPTLPCQQLEGWFWKLNLCMHISDTALAKSDSLLGSTWHWYGFQWAVWSFQFPHTYLRNSPNFFHFSYHLSLRIISSNKYTYRHRVLIFSKSCFTLQNVYTMISNHTLLIL